MDRKTKKIINDNSNDTTPTMTILLGVCYVPGLALKALYIFN